MMIKRTTRLYTLQIRTKNGRENGERHKTGLEWSSGASVNRA